jgi:hypothetical protein
MTESQIHALFTEIADGDPGPMRVDTRLAQRRGRARLRWRRACAAGTPVLAAAAVAVVALGMGAGTARHRAGPAPAAVQEALKFAVADSTGTSPLQVRDVATGAVVAQVNLPTEPGSQAPMQGAHDGRTYVGDVATRNGRTYVVALYRRYPCQSWLYQFRVNSRGQPTAVTPLRARPTIAGAEVYDLAVSSNGQVLGYASASSGLGCFARKAQPDHVGIINIATGQMKQWTMPTSSAVNGVSLSANGGLLLYSLQLGPSVVRIIPASDPPGQAADRGRTVLRAAQFGPSQWISFAAISPDGSVVCFSVYPPGGGGPGRIYVDDLATGHLLRVASGATYPGLIARDPAVRQLLLHMPDGLARLDLSTGKLTYLPGWKGLIGPIAW